MSGKKKKEEQAKSKIPERPELKITGLWGDIDEESTSKATWDVLSMYDMLVQESWEKAYGHVEEGGDEGGHDELAPPQRPSFEFIINSRGGSTWEMFALYDVMREIRENCDIETKGLGKVMSAAILLLAAGTKGRRKIGRNCRVMIHNMSAEHGGTIEELDNELGEAMNIQSLYIDALFAETEMTKKQIKEYLAMKTDVYFSAEEAVKFGIADIIV